MNFVFIGFPRVGKTYFGQKLAQKLARPFIDSDQLIMADQFKKTQQKEEVHEIYQRLGEIDFRILEKQLIEAHLVSNAIFSVGGGTILHPASLRILKSYGVLVYLSLCKEKVYDNLKQGRIPHYLNPQEFDVSFEKMYQKRLEIYQKNADVELNITGLSEGEILERLTSLCLIS